MSHFFQNIPLPPFIFSQEDIEILEKYGSRLSELASGTRSPSSFRERKFVDNVSYANDEFGFLGDSEPTPLGRSAEVWLRYTHYLQILDRHETERQNLKSQVRALLKRISYLEEEVTKVSEPLQKEIDQLRGYLKHCQAKLSKLEANDATPEVKEEPTLCPCQGLNESCIHCGGSGWVGK